MDKRIKKILKNPLNLFMTLGIRGCFNWMPDRTYLQIAYFCGTLKKLHLDQPKLFNEKLQWLKLHDRRDIYTEMVDKYLAKSIAAEVLGEGHIIKTYGIWDTFDEIDFDKLPDSFVLKCTHDSGSIVICRDKTCLDREKAKHILSQGLRRNYFYAGREWPYKNVKPRIIGEEYMTDESGTELKDYKLHTFSGKVKLIEVDYGRFSKHRRNFYDCAWNYLPFTTKFPTDPKHQFKRPDCLSSLIHTAESLADYAGTPPYLRVDLYLIHNQIVFGEFTFYHGGGLEKFTPEEWNLKVGAMVDISRG